MIPDVELVRDPSLQLIGEGRSAFVYRIQSTDKVVKIFFPSFTHLAKEEASIYQVLQGVRYYPELHETGPNYLVIDYIEGHTLFECLTKGIEITDKHTTEVDKALRLARAKGLNPSDIHLRNIMITTNDQIKLIDVARFRQSKECTQWDDLKVAFNRFYRLRFFPKKIPAFILNLIAALYKRNLLQTLTRTKRD
ncbi:protein kinase family protein [Ammoniphilus sp. CFH 90114]|uniref:protein kinase family protein n=1 Tax=Ammoniphilus sp. CFH 90114 TaxID=2493665 RepID=UPI00100EA030|nr:protein kinase family protein [Ammoniphilus sp. CFH 90114]RXT13705.1 protein kinase family protein [Ammoniphilus sp. CFH 90114]